jgi:hypothetical protein
MKKKASNSFRKKKKKRKEDDCALLLRTINFHVRLDLVADRGVVEFCKSRGSRK